MPIQKWLLNRADLIITTSPNYAFASTHLSLFLNKIQILPIIPTLSNISDFRPSYEPKELKIILDKINDEYKKTEDSFSSCLF
jgi:hypothetical protein